MKKKTLIIILIFILLALFITFLYFRKGVNGNTIAFISAKAQYGYISKTVTATGTIQPVDTVSVGAQVSGVIKEVYVDFNSVVKKGQLLAKVDPSIIIAQKDQAKANLDNAISNLNYQENNFFRQSRLYKLGAISKAIFQLDSNQLNIAKAFYTNAMSQLSLANKNLSYTNIYSPINGVILYKNISAGQTIASSFNAPTLFVIANDLNKMQVRAAVDEADIGNVATGQTVLFTVDAFPDITYEGVIRQILLRPNVYANVVTYTIIIDIKNDNQTLKPGMTANVNIYIEEDTNALLIPLKALSFKPDSTMLNGFKIIRSINLKSDSSYKLNSFIKKKPIKNIIVNEYNTGKVWTKLGRNIIEKNIVTHLNENGFVKVLYGISDSDEIIISISNNNYSENKNSNQKSPFIPQMQRRSSSHRN